MAKESGGLIAFTASGQLGKTVVYSSWRGRQYVRRWVVPSNPKSTKQVQVRQVFSWLWQVYKRAPTLFTAQYVAAAKGKPLTDRNVFGSINIKNLQTAADLSAFDFGPGVGGGPPPLTITATAGAGSITVGTTNPAVPTGWTLAAMIAFAIADQDPHSGVLYTITAGEDTATFDSVDLSGLTTGSLYRVGAILQWTKPDGSTAYSTALTGSATPT